MLNDNLNGNEFKALQELVRDLLLRNPLQSASVTVGRVRIGGSAILLIDSTGGLVIDGLLIGEGDLQWEGPATLDGDVTITKTLDVSAATKLRGLLELLNDLRVKAGGKITVEGSDPVTFGVTSSGAPGLEWSAGGRLAGGASSVSMAYGDKRAIVGAAGAILSSGTNRVVVTAAGTTIEGALFADLPLKSGAASNLHIDGNGKLWRTS